MIKKYVFLMNILLIFGQYYPLNEKQGIKKSPVKNFNKSRTPFKTAIIKRDLCVIGAGLLLYAIGIYARVFRYPSIRYKVESTLNECVNPKKCWIIKIGKDAVNNKKCRECKGSFLHDPLLVFCSEQQNILLPTKKDLICRKCVIKNKYDKMPTCPLCRTENFEKRVEACAICKTEKSNVLMRCLNCSAVGNNCVSCAECLKQLNKVRKHRIDTSGYPCPLPSVNCPFCYDGRD